MFLDAYGFMASGPKAKAFPQTPPVFVVASIPVDIPTPDLHLRFKYTDPAYVKSRFFHLGYYNLHPLFYQECHHATLFNRVFSIQRCLAWTSSLSAKKFMSACLLSASASLNIMFNSTIIRS